MLQKSPAKIKVTEIQQVCIVVNDLQKTIEAYWNILGIGPWAILEFESSRIPDVTSYGKPTWSKYQAAIAQAGPVELKLCETIEGVPLFQGWIDEHGEGLHHLNFISEDVARTEKILKMD